jgi:hypothetical protein
LFSGRIEGSVETVLVVVRVFWVISVSKKDGRMTGFYLIDQVLKVTMGI